MKSSLTVYLIFLFVSVLSARRNGMSDDFMSSLRGTNTRGLRSVSSYVVKVNGNATQIANDLGLQNTGQIGQLDGWYEFKGFNNIQSLEHPDIVYSELIKPEFMQKKLSVSDPLYNQQWHLENKGQYTGTQAGNDVNAQSAWDAGYSGNNVLIQFVDDGLLYTHSEVAGKYVASASYDINGDDNNPTPSLGDTHGTECTGVAAASRDNGVCGLGAAYNAKVSAIRLLAQGFTGAEGARAFSTYTLTTGVAISSNSWGSIDSGFSFYTPATVLDAARETAAKSGRNGKGVVLIWAAGNGGADRDNCNYSGLSASPYIISVGASNANGIQSIYSESCAALLVNAPSNDLRSGMPGITTMTSSSNSACASNFGGTSSSGPLVAGIAALVLEANPSLTYRDVMHILAETASMNDPTSSSWSTNGAGMSHSHKYGFGRVNAGSAVLTAKNWNSVGLLTKLSGLDSPSASIEFNSPVTSSISVSSLLNAEHVAVYVNIVHPYPNELEIVLISPSGTESVLAEPHNTGNNPIIRWGNDNSLWYSEYTSFSPKLTSTFSANAIQVVYAPTSCNVFVDLLKRQIASLNGAIAVVLYYDSLTYCDAGTLAINLQAIDASAVFFYNPASVSISGASGSSILSTRATVVFLNTVIDLADSAGYFNSGISGYGPFTITDEKIPTDGDLSNNYRFVTVRNWKEKITGNWNLRVTDKVSGDTGTFNSWSMEIFAYDASAVNNTIVASTTGTTTDESSDSLKLCVSLLFLFVNVIVVILL